MQKPNCLNNGIPWKIEFDAAFFFEIESEKIRHKLPPTVHPMEVRPGMSLLGVGVQRFLPGNLGYLPAFFEISLMLPIQPDLSQNMQPPQFCFACVAIVSENPDFLRHTQAVDKMPTYLSPGLSIRYTDRPVKVTAEDGDGFILSIQNTHPNPVYSSQTIWGQCLNVAESRLYFQAWKWEGSSFEHQNRGIAGELNIHHPIWQGIDLSGITGHCYMQLVPDVSSEMKITFYEPVMVREFVRQRKN